MNTTTMDKEIKQVFSTIKSIQITPNVRLFSKKFKLFGSQIGNRMTVIKINKDQARPQLLIHSPIEVEPGLLDHLNQMGDVVTIIMPNLFHYLHVSPYATAFPNASLYGPKNIENKLKDFDTLNGAQKIRLQELVQTNPWSPDIDCMCVEGMPSVNEVVFLHKPSRTLIVTDLVFNLHNKKGWSKLMFGMLGVHNKCGSSKIFKSFIKDKAQFRQSVESILEWDFENLVVSHGDIIQGNAKEIVKESFSWCVLK